VHHLPRRLVSFHPHFSPSIRPTPSRRQHFRHFKIRRMCN
jgi:hypothetical protein